MLICPFCNAGELAENSVCSACGFHPEIIKGFEAWAPNLANHSRGFRAEYFAGLFQGESLHFWFRARNRFIIWALGKYFPEFDSLLEVGCGTGFVLSEIARKYPSKKLSGSEIFVEGLKFASRRLPNARLFQMDARQMPFRDEFDMVCAFDVIEHIREDELVLGNIYRAIKPGGGCLITVPQHMWLWSVTDEQACHQRRYSASELHRKLEAAGFQLLRSTSFVTSLLPAMALSRFLQKEISANEDVPTEGLKMPPILNSIFYHILWLELALISRGANFPVGGSRLVVARKL